MAQANTIIFEVGSWLILYAAVGGDRGRLTILYSQIVQSQIQLQDIHSGFAEETKISLLRMLLD